MGQLQWAKDEVSLKILGRHDAECLVYVEMLAVVEAFIQQGHSGGSASHYAPRYAEDLRKLLMQEAITPLTGEDDEWNDRGESTWQNKRDSAVFKQDHGTLRYAYDLGAVTFIHDEDISPDTDIRYHTVTNRSYVRAYYDLVGYIEFPYTRPSKKPIVHIESLKEGKIEIVGYAQC